MKNQKKNKVKKKTKKGKDKLKEDVDKKGKKELNGENPQIKTESGKEGEEYQQEKIEEAPELVEDFESVAKGEGKDKKKKKKAKKEDKDKEKKS